MYLNQQEVPEREELAAAAEVPEVPPPLNELDAQLGVTSGPCLDFAGADVICIPWFSVDFWQEILDYRNVLRIEPFET